MKTKQIDYIIKEATSIENLSELYEGWTPWVQRKLKRNKIGFFFGNNNFPQIEKNIKSELS